MQVNDIVILYNLDQIIFHYFQQRKESNKTNKNDKDTGKLLIKIMILYYF